MFCWWHSTPLDAGTKLTILRSRVHDSHHLASYFPKILRKLRKKGHTSLLNIYFYCTRLYIDLKLLFETIISDNANENCMFWGQFVSLKPIRAALQHGRIKWLIEINDKREKGYSFYEAQVSHLYLKHCSLGLTLLTKFTLNNGVWANFISTCVSHLENTRKNFS